MAITREKKEEIVQKTEAMVKNAESVAFVNFHGLSVEDTNKLRSTLRDKDVAYYVLKKKLARRVLEGAGIKGELPELSGEFALATASDPVAPAREVYEFSKKHKDTLSLIGGIFEGRFMDKEEMTEIASIPSLEVLYGKVVNVINSPISGLVVALGQIAEAKPQETA